MYVYSDIVELSPVGSIHKTNHGLSPNKKSISQKRSLDI